MAKAACLETDIRSTSSVWWDICLFGILTFLELLTNLYKLYIAKFALKLAV